MIARLGQLKERVLPRAVEMYLLLAAILVGVSAALYRYIYRIPIATVLLAGAIGGTLAIFFGGSQLCLALYYTTNLGAELRFPGIPVSLNKLLAALFLGAAIYDLLRFRKSIALSVSLILFFLFNLYYITCAFLFHIEGSPYPFNSIFYVLPVIVIATLFWRDAWLNRLLKAFLAITLLLAVIPGLAELATGRELTTSGFTGAYDRIDGLSNESIIYAYVLTWALPIALFFFIESKRIEWKIYYFLGALMLMLLPLLTQNRQSPIITAAVVVTFVFFVRYTKRHLLILTLLLGGLAISPFIIAKLLERFMEARSILTDHSLLFRHDKILIAMEMWKEHFWFGIGFDNFPIIWREYRPENGTMMYIDINDPKAHHIDSGYIHLMTEFGFVGVVLFGLLLLSSFVLWVRLYLFSLRIRSKYFTNLLAVLAAMMAQFLVAMLISDASVRLQTFYMFAILYAIHARLRMEYREALKAGGGRAEDLPA